MSLWWTSLDRAPGEVASLAIWLSPPERARAARFRFERLRSRFVVGRGVLREILGHHLRCDPGRVRLEADPHGKPRLAEGALEFNLTHAEGLALYAVSRGAPVGVDVELIRPLSDLDALAARVFSTRERASLATWAGPERLTAFLRGWTRKEAYLKARGDGLRYPVAAISVSLDPDTPARLLDVAGEPAEAARWSLHDLPGLPGAIAALAVAGRAAVSSCRSWPGSASASPA